MHLLKDRKNVIIAWLILDQLLAAGIDPSGGSGEYHTVVTDGPLFKSPVSIRFSEQVPYAGYWFRA